MSYIEHTDQLTLDFAIPSAERPKLTLYAKQEDSARRVIISLKQFGEDYTVPVDVIVMLRATKPDGHFLITECPAVGSKVYLQIPKEMLTSVGCVRAEICLMAADEILTSGTFFVEVLPNAMSDVASGNDVSALAMVLDTAATLMRQAMFPVAVETVPVGPDFDTTAKTVVMYKEKPVWNGKEFATTEEGAQYSDYLSALRANAVYFYQGNDRSTYCKLTESAGSCTGYIRYGLLGTSGGLAKEFRTLLDGDTVEGRKLPTEAEAKALTQLMTNHSISKNSSTYYLVEHSILQFTVIWIDCFVNSLLQGTAVDFGDGTHKRFVTEEELEKLNRRIAALES